MAKVWWCNQTDCWDDEYAAGYVCAAEPRGPGGLKYRRMVSQIRRGDIVLHYLAGTCAGVVAVSRAESSSQYGIVPVRGPRCWTHRAHGWYVRARYHAFGKPILRHRFIKTLAALRIPEGPTSASGRIRYAYLTRASPRVLAIIKAAHASPDAWPHWAR